VFQAFHLLAHRTATENVALAMLYEGVAPRERYRRARAELERVGLGNRLQAAPGQLSGGQRQRVAIARACVGRPQLLLCDEPTGNLDSATASAMLDLLDELHQAGQTIVVITHDNAVAARAERTIAVADGHVTEVPR
jgi:putative ABC transport system ATP-binding protein